MPRASISALMALHRDLGNTSFEQNDCATGGFVTELVTTSGIDSARF